MTHDDIIHMATEAGFECFQWQKDGSVEVVFNGCEGPVTEQMKRLVALVATAEREAIATMILDTKEWRGRGGFSTLCNDTRHIIATAIRAKKDGA